MTAKQFFMLHVMSPNIRIFKISTISLFIFSAHLCCAKHVYRSSRHINSMLDFRNQIRIKLIINTLFRNPWISSLLINPFRLCVLASGSLIIIFPCFILIRVSCLHFGQNNGKFINSVSSRILVRILLLQILYVFSIYSNHKESFRFYKCRRFTRYSLKDASSALEI